VGPDCQWVKKRGTEKRLLLLGRGARLGWGGGSGPGGKGRGRIGPSGQNADGESFPFSFVFSFYSQKLFKTHFKFILNFLDFLTKPHISIK